MNPSSIVQTAFDKLLKGNQEGIDELLGVVACPDAAMSSAVAVGLLYLRRPDLLPGRFAEMAPFALYTWLMMCEKYKDPAARGAAKSILDGGDFPWQTRCKALWYLVSLGECAAKYDEIVHSLRTEFESGISYQLSGLAPDPSFQNQDMAELQLIGLEILLS